MIFFLLTMRQELTCKLGRQGKSYVQICNNYIKLEVKLSVPDRVYEGDRIRISGAIHGFAAKYRKNKDLSGTDRSRYINPA